LAADSSAALDSVCAANGNGSCIRSIIGEPGREWQSKRNPASHAAEKLLFSYEIEEIIPQGLYRLRKKAEFRGERPKNHRGLNRLRKNPILFFCEEWIEGLGRGVSFSAGRLSMR
jgi:hypothetical protein